MAQMEARYQVYISNGALIGEIEEYCEDNDVSASEAFRDAMKAKLEN